VTRSFSSLSQEYAEGNILVDIYFLTGYDSAQWAAKQRKTGKLQPDEWTIEWARHVTAGYLDQHAHLTAGMTIESILASAFNHLDVDAKEELKRALKEYKGSILMVCHEPDFYQDIVTEEWDCTKWTTKVF